MGDCICGCLPGEEKCGRPNKSPLREHKDLMAGVDDAARRDYPAMMREVNKAMDAVEDEIGDVPNSVLGEARWFNALGEEVDLDNIDAEYALNIYTLAVKRRGFLGFRDDEMREDPLLNKLRDVILNGREKNLHDRMRAHRYNVMCRFRNLPFRAR